MLFAASFALAAIAAVSASPVEPRSKTQNLPLKHVSNVKDWKGIVQKGKSRLDMINGKTVSALSADVSSGDVTNEDVSYVAAVDIGGYTRDLIVDTGSSNTWCGAQDPCERTSSGNPTGGSVSVSYGSGSFSGYAYKDSVSFGGLTVPEQSIGAAYQSSGFTGVDGIFGFGPVGLTQGTVSNARTVPTFMDNLYRRGDISTEVLGVSFRPEPGSDTSEENGELTLGGTDSSKYTGSISYFQRLETGAAAPYWGLTVSKFNYGSKNLASNVDAVIDTGTTLIYIPTSAYNAFLSATGGTTDSASGLASFTEKPTATFKIRIGSQNFNLTPSQYLVPTAQYGNFGLLSNKYYAWINNGGSSGVNCLIGQKFLENYYSVYDTTNSRIGFAKNS